MTIVPGYRRLAALDAVTIALGVLVMAGSVYVDLGLAGRVPLVDPTMGTVVTVMAVLWLLALAGAITGLATRRGNLVACIVVLACLASALLPTAITGISFLLFVAISPT